jgi:hypothetical protein
MTGIRTLAAAILWGWSAFVYIPVLHSGWGSLVSIMQDGSPEIGEAPFYTALKKISRLNARAAAFACLSAVAQAVTLLPHNGTNWSMSITANSIAARQFLLGASSNTRWGNS